MEFRSSWHTTSFIKVIWWISFCARKNWLEMMGHGICFKTGQSLVFPLVWWTGFVGGKFSYVWCMYKDVSLYYVLLWCYQWFKEWQCPRCKANLIVEGVSGCDVVFFIFDFIIPVFWFNIFYTVYPFSYFFLNSRVI